jgi:hypothetical protein
VSGDEITLTIPRQEGFDRVAHLVVGGIAVRLNLTFENLDDLEVALDALLERARNEGDVTVTVQIRDETIHALIGPFTAEVHRELEGDAREGFGLRRVLDTVVDGVEVTKREDGHWVGLTKRVHRAKTVS